MQPLTHTVHKALLPIVDKPVVAHIIDDVINTPGVEVSEIIFITGHLKEQIEEWANNTYDLPMRFVHQKVQNGTAHAIKLVKDYIDEDMLIIFPDALFDVDYQAITDNPDLDGVIWTQEVAEPQHFGVVAHDQEMLMTELIEKPTNPPSNLVNIGMYYIRDYQSAFAMIDMLYEHEIKAKGEYNFPEALDLMAKNGKQILVEPVEGWHDCGRPETTLKTNEEYTRRAGIDNRSSVHEDAVIENSTLFNCIVLQDARITDCDLKNSIVGPRTVLKHIQGSVFSGSDTRIEGKK